MGTTKQREEIQDEDEWRYTVFPRLEAEHTKAKALNDIEWSIWHSREADRDQK